MPYMIPIREKDNFRGSYHLICFSWVSRMSEKRIQILIVITWCHFSCFNNCSDFIYLTRRMWMSCSSLLRSVVVWVPFNSGKKQCVLWSVTVLHCVSSWGEMLIDCLKRYSTHEMTWQKNTLVFNTSKIESRYSIFLFFSCISWIALLWGH